MKFSVLINNYNYGRFVGAAIESVLAQTHTDFELIIVDDGSTDESRGVIERYQDPRIRTIFQTNQGQGAAFKTGFAAATGDAIALLDSDDEWYPEKLARCLPFLERNPHLSLLQHEWDFIDRTGTILRSHTLPLSGEYEPLSDYRRLRFDLPFGPTSCIVGHRRFFQKLVFESATWRLAADTPVIAGLSVLGRCYFLTEKLTRYRVHGENGFEGRQDYGSLLELRRRFYHCVDEHLASQPNSSQPHRFETSSAYQGRYVTATRAWTLAGLVARFRYRRALARGQ